jgi:hypothetical protein
VRAHPSNVYRAATNRDKARLSERLGLGVDVGRRPF